MKQKLPSVATLLEPIELWRNFSYNGEHWSPLNELYKNPDKEIFNFQLLVLSTYANEFVRTYSNALSEGAKYFLTERTLSSSIEIFAKYYRNTNILSSYQYALLSNVFRALNASNPIFQTYDEIIYLQTEPEQLRNRIIMRSREEEQSISLMYLSNINRMYQEWAVDRSFEPNHVDNPIHIFDASYSVDILCDHIVSLLSSLE